jgi:1-acyl-sn-glycerol-3-phosphate acyltransferase
MHSVVHNAFHWIWHLITYPFIWFYIDPVYRPGFLGNSARLPKPPFIMLSNHGTFFDPWLIGRYSTRPVFYMCNDDAWRSGKIVQVYLTSIGAFPKKKGGVDYRALKTTLRILNTGAPVCIFPEGQTSWDGETQLIYRGLEKLVRKARVPVVIFNLCGNFLVKPWWARVRRSGRVLVSMSVLDVAGIAELTDDELFQAIKSGVYHNDIKDERNSRAPFKGKELAGGLERFVWICMHCGAEDALVTAGDEVGCAQCRRRWQIDVRCRLRPLAEDTASLGDLKDWSDMHRDRVLQKIAATPAGEVITESADVVVRTLADDGYTFVDRLRGTLVLRHERLSFVSQENGSVFLDIPCSEIKDPVVQKKDIFELRHHDTYYRFVFDHHSPMKWVYYLRYLGGYEEFEKRGYL